MKNYNCDGVHCTHSDGELRLLPTGGDSNMILCYDCYRFELNYRKFRNRTLAKECKFALPNWKDLKIYERA